MGVLRVCLRVRVPPYRASHTAAGAWFASEVRLPTTGVNLTQIDSPLREKTDLRTGADLPFNAQAVRFVRRAYHIPTTPSRRQRELTVDEVAQRLGVSPGAIYYSIRHGKLAARRDRAHRLRIPFPPDVEQGCRERIANSAHIPQTKITATGGAV